MNRNVFNIENFNILKDENFFYFFRALNNADNNDINSGITIDTLNNILKIRTDRERYIGKTKYNSFSQVSLEEVYDHIKMHYRKDTNCISLSSNANVSLVYGRGSYKDKYVLVKVPKDKMDESHIINAGEYMLYEINKRIELVINEISDEQIITFIKQIDNVKSNSELKELLSKKLLVQANNSEETQKIKFRTKSIRITNYQCLNEEQLLEKNKIIAKLNFLKSNNKISSIIPYTPDNKLIETVGNAFSSMEQIHYGEILENEILNVPTIFVDIFALLQQMPIDYKNITDEIKKELLILLNNKSDLLSKEEIIDYSKFTYNNNIDIEKMYELTSGQFDYNIINSLLKKIFYLSKSKLRARELGLKLDEITRQNPKYKEVINKIIEYGYTIEPEIIQRKSGIGYKLSESVNLDLTEQEISILEKINSMTSEELFSIIKGENILEIKNILLPLIYKYKRNTTLDKETYIAAAIVDSYDWSNLDIIEFSTTQKNELIEKIKEYKCLELYNKLKAKGFTEKNIQKYLIRIIVKKIHNFDNFNELNKEISIDELEDFLEYYRISGTKIKLKDYQLKTVQNINKILNLKQFAATVLPTGAGKSFVALAEMLQYKNNPILYLAPSNEILEQMKDYIIEYIHGKKGTLLKTKDEVIKEVFPNLTFVMYPSLISKENENIINKQYKFIVFDELHRTGAKEWKNKIDKLISDQNEETKYLGITATPQRDSDNINMADELASQLGFNESEIINQHHIAMHLDLLDAIRLGIVINPKIVNCEYILNNNGFMDNLLEKINSVKDDNFKNQYLKKFDELRKKINLAEGIPEILQKNIKIGGKYIVFIPITNQEKTCFLEDEDRNSIDDKASKKLIKKYENQIKEYFKGSNITPEFYSMLGSYSKAENLSQLNNFENNGSNNTKFMIVMNKLNEGIHVKDVDGIIWLRALDENSKILYLQQLGRIIYSISNKPDLPDEKRPIAIDLTNNTLRINMHKESKIYTKRDDFELLSTVVDWCISHGQEIPNINSTNSKESKYASILIRIQNEYLKYINDEKNLINLDKTIQQSIINILNKGAEIDLWNIQFSQKENTVASEKIDIESFEITGILKDYNDLFNEVDKNQLCYEEKIIEFINLINHGYIPTKKDAFCKFSNGEPINMFWSNNKEKIFNELDNNPKYQNGFDTAKSFVKAYIKKYRESLDKEHKIMEYIDMLNNGYIPVSNEINAYFSDGRLIKFFWENNKDEITNELNNNPKYALNYKVAKNIVNKKISRLTYEERINEYIHFLNKGYIPKSMETQLFFSDGNCVGSFWNRIKTREDIYNVLLSNENYQYGFEVALNYMTNILNKLSNEEKVIEFIELLNKGYIPFASKDKENQFSDGSLINAFWKLNKEKILSKLNSDSKYKNGYTLAKQTVINIQNEKNNKLSLEQKIHEFIEYLNTGYVPKKDEKQKKFSNGDLLNQFWKRKLEIIEVLNNSPKYTKGYEIAKNTINSIINKLTKEQKIEEFIEMLNTGYVPIDREYEKSFSDGSLLNIFWMKNKNIIETTLNQEKYNVDYELAKIILMLKTSDKTKRLSNEYIYNIALEEYYKLKPKSKVLKKQP